MIYKIDVYNKGEVHSKNKVEASSHYEAARKSAIGRFSHIVVRGRTTKRFDRKFNLIREEPKFFKVYKGSGFPTILVMYGSFAEFHVYETDEAMQKAFEEIVKCTTSTFVGSAKTEVEPTDTTVSLDETKGTKNTSTSKKILSGSVTSATWQDLLTRDSIGKRSGTPKSGGTGMDTWSTGWTHFPSKQKQILPATVKTLPEFSPWPGVNYQMKQMEGKTFLFEQKEDSKFGKTWKVVGGSWIWLDRWLDFENVYAKVATYDDKIKHIEVLDNGVHLTYRPRYAGEILHLHKCGCGCGAYFHNGVYYSKKWLEFNGYHKNVATKSSIDLKKENKYE